MKLRLSVNYSDNHLEIFNSFIQKELNFIEAYIKLRNLHYSPTMAKKHLQDVCQNNNINYQYYSIEELEKYYNNY